MPFDTAMVGQRSEAISQRVDARWLMAYAAGLGDCSPVYCDNSAGGIVAHPVFPVCLEWPVLLSLHDTVPGYTSVTTAEHTRGVHGFHDTHHFRPIVVGDVLTTQAKIIGLYRSQAGAMMTLRLDTSDAGGELVCRSYMLNIGRGVGVIGDDTILESLPETPYVCADAKASDGIPMEIRAGDAHIYTECSRIWNPIHTDRAVALAAGLPDIILHGTAIVGKAVSVLLDRFVSSDVDRVSRLGGRFTGMVTMPSTLHLMVQATRGGTVSFDIVDHDNRAVFSRGYICIG